MVASQFLQFGLDALFAGSGVFAVWAIAASWMAARPALAALHRELAWVQAHRDYRFTITTPRLDTARVLPFSRGISRPVRPAAQAPGLDWPGLRAAA